MRAYIVLSFIFLFSTIILFRVNQSQINFQSLVSFDKGLNPLHGALNFTPYEANKSVQISMDETRSSGFQSKLMYMHGYFESSIKLPDNYSVGVVVTFYTCNDPRYPYRDDEIDLSSWDTSMVKNGWCRQISMEMGVLVEGEDRYVLWFDPLKDFHHYGILWTDDRITYYVDDVPIRRVRRVEAMRRGDFPSKEMGLYGTIWNGSDGATNGGQHKLDLSYGPYVAKYSGFVLNGCAFNPTQKP